MLASRCYGQPTNPCLVLLHGLLGDKQDWQDLMPRLSQHVYCVCLDLPSHGDSPSLALPSPGFMQVASLIRRTLTALNIETFHLLGYSLGGRIALHLAQLMPQQILSVNLESCHPGLTSQALREQRLHSDKQWHERMLQMSLNEFLNLWYRQTVFSDLSDSARAQLIQRRSHNKLAALQQIYLPTSLGLQQDLSCLPHQLGVPWHYYVGGQDDKFAALATAWQQRAPLTLHRFEHGGHNIHLSCCDAFCTTLIEQLIMTDTTPDA